MPGVKYCVVMLVIALASVGLLIRIGGVVVIPNILGGFTLGVWFVLLFDALKERKEKG